MQGPWGPLSDEPTAPPPPAGFLADLWANLRAGLRLAIFVPVGRDAFRLTSVQAAAFFLLGAVLMAGMRLASAIGYRFHFRLPPPEVLGISAAALAILGALAYVFGRLHRNSVGGAGIIVIVGSAMIAPTLAFAAHVPTMILVSMGQGRGLLWLGYAIGWFFFILPTLWLSAAFIRSLSVACGVGVPRALLLSLLPFLLATLPDHIPDLLESSESEEDTADITPAEESPLPRLNAEQTFYAQPELVDRAIAALSPERPGVTDLYLVSFAGYARQNVFRSEVEKVTALFDTRFDTKGRSVMLVNNADTVERTPVASATNLKHVLAGVAARMNRDDDVLFLFLTSHGSPQSLAVEFMPLWLNNISPGELDRMLDEAGIKWRVLVVSACYSGSFVDALKDENSLIITAARADRTSFGCGNEDEYTYFGDAYFNRELRRQSSFITAFDGAAATIAKREHDEGLEPSEPQIYVGPAIRAKLAEFERQLSARPAAVPDAGG
jgi:hypothetical protein